jgi:hypothetical protein
MCIKQQGLTPPVAIAASMLQLKSAICAINEVPRKRSAEERYLNYVDEGPPGHLHVLWDLVGELGWKVKHEHQ